ncbi:MAG: Luciferase-like monooxygenase [Propionibacteriaceae bacterium]|nr:Luciferase-like monooxygenase [Propionibacteriaceae bacterium]
MGPTLTDYKHDLLFGSFITPSSQAAEQVVKLAQLSERAGLDLVTFQDHPYQPGFLDTWTLLSWVAAQTRSITVSGNVLNLPLRPPAVLARSAASLDLLSGGRFELGLGAGGFWDAIEAMGGRRLGPGQAVAALEEAITVMRQLWDTDERGGVRFDGQYYQAHGAKRGPAPAHDISIWLGAYKPKMLGLVGRQADGWLPSLGYLQAGDLAAGNKLIDEAAAEAGRHPADIRRLLNVSGAFSRASQGHLHGPVEQWVEELAELALTDGISAFIVMADDADTIARIGQEVAPAVRELVDSERTASILPREAAPIMVSDGADEWSRLGLRPTPDPGVRLAAAQPWDETSRPRRVPTGPNVSYSDHGRAVGRHLIDVHDHLRAELESVRDVLSQVRRGAVDAGAARSVINELTMRQNDWTLGAYCASYCRTVTQHHSMEDASIFPHLRRSDQDLGAVLDRLTEEHHVIHEVLELLDERLVEFIAAPDDFTGLQDAIDLLTDTLLSHLAYEEDQLVEPLARLGFYPNQV